MVKRIGLEQVGATGIKAERIAESYWMATCTYEGRAYGGVGVGEAEALRDLTIRVAERRPWGAESGATGPATCACDRCGRPLSRYNRSRTRKGLCAACGALVGRMYQPW